MKDRSLEQSNIDIISLDFGNFVAGELPSQIIDRAREVLDQKIEERQLRGAFVQGFGRDLHMHLSTYNGDLQQANSLSVSSQADLAAGLKALEEAQESMPRTKVEEETDEVCVECERPMVIKTGRFGRFLACTGFPECKHTRPILKKTGAKCPNAGCGGEIVERRAKGRGRSFYGCSRYPQCDFISNKKPMPTPCPECSGLVVQANRSTASCTACDWSEGIGEESAELAQVGD